MQKKYLQTHIRAIQASVTVALLLTPYILYAIDTNPLVPCDGPGDCNVSTLIGLVQNIINFFMILVPFVAAALFAWGGVLYMTARGDPGQIGKAHKLFGYAVFGLVITLAAWLIVYTIFSGLEVETGFWLLGGSEIFIGYHFS